MAFAKRKTTEYCQMRKELRNLKKKMKTEQRRQARQLERAKLLKLHKLRAFDPEATDASQLSSAARQQLEEELETDRMQQRMAAYQNISNKRLVSRKCQTRR